MKVEWDKLIDHLNSAYHNEIMKDLRSRYNTNLAEEDRADEYRGYDREAISNFHMAKQLYLSNKDKFDSFSLSTENPLDLKSFRAFKKVIEEEMSREIENILGKEDL